MTLTQSHDAIILSDQGPDYFSAEQMATRFVQSYRSEHTRRALEGDLSAEQRSGAMSFFDWCRAVGVHPLLLHRRQVPVWSRYLSELGLSPATAQRKVSTPRCFYRHVVDVEQQLEVNPFPERNKALHLPPVPDESQTRALSVDEWRRMRDAAERAGAWRDAAVLTTLFYQGLRAAELCALEQDSMTWESGQELMKVRGKGGKVRTVVVDPLVTEAVEHMLTTRVHGRDVQVPDGNSRLRPVFVGRDGKSVTPHQVAWVVNRWAAEGGVKGKVTPHCFRHTCATLMLEAGVPIREVQRFLGHVNPATTQRYDARREQIANSPVHKLHAAVEHTLRNLTRTAP